MHANRFRTSAAWMTLGAGAGVTSLGLVVMAGGWGGWREAAGSSLHALVAALSIAFVSCLSGLGCLTSRAIAGARAAVTASPHPQEETLEPGSVGAGLVDTREQMQAILDHTPAVIYVKDLDGRYLLGNLQFERLFHWSRRDIIGKTDFDMFPAEMAAAFRTNDRAVLEAGTALTFEEVAPHGDGPHTYISTKFPLRRPDSGVYALCGISTDITDRKGAEQELHRTRSFLESIVENLPNMVFVKEAADLRFVLFNRAGEELLGYRRQELLGKNDHDFFPKQQADFFTGIDRTVLAASNPVDTSEEEISTRANGTRILHTRKAAIRDAAGRPAYLLGISEDITERKLADRRIRALNDHLQHQTARLREANEELESFSCSVSHDLRAPLRHMAGFSELLVKHAGPALDGRGTQLLGAITDSARRMAALIDALLDFSKLGRAAMQIRPLLLRDLVADLVRELEEAGDGRKIHWIIGELPEVEADATLLRAALANLLSNAAKYTRENPQPRVEIDTLRAGASSEPIVVLVRDNGVGFDMRYAEKLFGVFQRLHPESQFEGAGIGLATARRIIARHGGRTWAEGEVGRGATFYFSLPRQGEAA